MIYTIIEFSRYLCALLFGTTVAVNFAGMPGKPKNYLVVGCLIIVLFILQILCLQTWGMEITIKIYPFLSHLPVVFFVALYLKRPWLTALTAMFTSFMCCQLPRWVGTVAGGVFHSAAMNHGGYIAAALIMYYFLKKYAFKPVQHMMDRSVKSCLLFGSMPAFYYFFDYATTVYTDFMYRGSMWALQFMPFMTSLFYFVFILLYYTETQKEANIQRERDMLDNQLRQAQKEFASLRQIQKNAAEYRHDMRHHISLLQAMASKGQLEAIKEYLGTVESDIDEITPIRFCENEAVNLIVSYFSSKAKQAGIIMTIDAKLPERLTLSNTELCSLLSNALENAIHASGKVEDIKRRLIKLHLFSKNNKLCVDIRNTYHKEPVFHEGFPVSNIQGHGFGTKSIASIIEKHGGVYRFSVNDGWFIFQATI